MAESWVKDFFKKPKPRSAIPDEDSIQVYEGSVVRGNAEVRRRWDIEERRESKRLERENKEVWDD